MVAESDGCGQSLAKLRQWGLTLAGKRSKVPGSGEAEGTKIRGAGGYPGHGSRDCSFLHGGPFPFRALTPGDVREAVGKPAYKQGREEGRKE